jgi:3-isopropylmalate/(R)-2-methylmalate dehydratase small subunit
VYLPEVTNMPRPISHLHGIALPLLRDNVDTDEIIPVWENTRFETVDWGDGLFAAKRYIDGAGHTSNPHFILNKTPFDRATLLVSGVNFGSGSSRESAVWALRDYGFRAVIAVSFNETFMRNCIINGVAPLMISRIDAEDLVMSIISAPCVGVTLTLQDGILRHGADPPGRSIAFQLDGFYCDLLTTGRTEDELLGNWQADIDMRRKRMLESSPWLQSSLPQK